jgi:hypothetical protein
VPTFWHALNVAGTTSESRRDGVKVAHDVSPGYTFDQNQKSPLRDWTHLSILPWTNVGYIHVVPSGLESAPGDVSSVTVDGPLQVLSKLTTPKSYFGQV